MQPELSLAGGQGTEVQTGDPFLRRVLLLFDAEEVVLDESDGGVAVCASSKSGSGARRGWRPRLEVPLLAAQRAVGVAMEVADA